MDDLLEVPCPGEAKKWLKRVLEEGEVKFTPHGLREMAKDNLTTVDCQNVLRGGVVDPPEWVNGEWRHQVRTQSMCFVVYLPLQSGLVATVITAWRYKK